MEAATFGNFLVEKGALSASALVRARASESATDVSFAQLLADLGLIGQSELKDSFLEYFNLSDYSPEQFPDKALDLPLSSTFLKAHKLLPVEAGDKQITIATADPTNGWPIEALTFALGNEPKLVIADEGEIKAAIDQLYFGQDESAEDDVVEALSYDVSRLQELASDAPVIRYVDRLIDRAVGLGASDIHLEPVEQGIVVRLRIDGLLSHTDVPDKGQEAAVLSRVKILAGLDIAERRLPQDGRLRQTVRGREMDFRVSTTPTLYGESIVLRLLDRGKLPMGLEDLGFNTDLLAPIDAAIMRPEGIVLVTGPTGSGKTTTLYAALRKRHTADVKILTIEDPVEYALDGINQVTVETKIGRTFAAALRSFLRQDPDIIMVGEIRDRETAEIAAQAAQTGHLVLSTLHTADAAGAFARLKDMGLPAYLIAPTITAVISQRLVRRLCDTCKSPVHFSQRDLLEAGLTEFDQTSDEGIEGFNPVGCGACRSTGYAGRAVIAEVLIVSDDIRALVMGDADTGEIKRAARVAGMRTMLEDGMKLVSDGKTSLQEILRVTRDG